MSSTKNGMWSEILIGKILNSCSILLISIYNQILRLTRGPVGYLLDTAIRCFRAIRVGIMSQSIPAGYIPPGNPWENFFERANPGHPGNSFCLILCPGAKMMVEFPGGWGKIFPNSKKLLRIKLSKVLKKLRRQ